jgi:hypothetical protein
MPRNIEISSDWPLSWKFDNGHVMGKAGLVIRAILATLLDVYNIRSITEQFRDAIVPMENDLWNRMK